MDTENCITFFMMHLLCEWHHVYHVLILLMTSTDSAASVWMSKEGSKNHKFRLFRLNLSKNDPTRQTIYWLQGGARWLIKILDKEKQRHNRLWMTICPTPGWGRAETLALLTEMVAKMNWHQDEDSDRHRIWEGDLPSPAIPILAI